MAIYKFYPDTRAQVTIQWTTSKRIVEKEINAQIDLF